ncbi:hypothetical protein KSP40_PGU000302 [Platanthera guangdongensis]|uniref:Uncharacterized protein n=1 Tax=Platanthera guangdongensis TaxID=2320717 RepID=A0ABR2LXJ3_9ASPA
MWLQTTVSGVRIAPHPQPAQKGRAFTSEGREIMIRIAATNLLNSGMVLCQNGMALFYLSVSSVLLHIVHRVGIN